MPQISSNQIPVNEQQTATMHLCEVCGTWFETRRGLSSHARFHLRQMGVCVSESSGAPISLLYELITERDGALPFTPKHTLDSHKKHTTHTQQPQKSHNTHSTGPKNTHNNPKKHATHTQHRSKYTSKHGARHGSGTKLKIKISELVKRQCVPVPTSPRVSSSSSSLSSSSFSSSSSPLYQNKPPKSPPSLPAPSKLGAPQKTDTPHHLMEISDVPHRDCVHVCELCGAWYETKKGLASHARAHLHHFGVELDPKASPIQVLHDLLQKKAVPVDKKLSAVLLTSPPFKKKKQLSPAREKTLRDSDSPKNANCEFCGENFKKTQSLASHARSHLRQLGVTDWTARGSPMATLRELMARRSYTSLPHPIQTTPVTLSKPSSEAPHLPVSNPTSPQFSKCQSEAPPTPAPGLAHVRVPKARKGSRMAVSKPKDEPMELDISIGQSTKTKPPELTTHVIPDADHTTVPANQNLSTGAEVGMAEPVKCDYCSDHFDSRKALSCHARAHLRQLGVKWAPFASPIDTLHELMIRVGRGSEGTPSPVDSYKEKTEMDGTSSGEATCELCGFDFENRKALASHARAHLRQQGEQWSSSQSPIAALSQWMSREPEKVAVLHKLYMQGTFPHIRKRRVCSPVPSFGADSAHSGVSRPSPAARQGKSGTGHSFSSNSHRKLSSHRPAPYSSVDHGSDHRPPKLFPLRAESLKRVGNAPSLVPRPPETSLVKMVGKIYSLKCRFCEQVFSGPLSVQEDWLIHLRRHILNLKPDHAPSPAPLLQNSEPSHLIGQAV